MKVGVYARVSTRDKGQETENQLAQLREFCEKHDWQITREYVDHETGGTSDRAQFQVMFADASKRKFDLLLFWSLDRLSREGVLETLQHLNRLTACGVGYKSFTEQYLDSCGIFKDAVIGILAVVAKQERVRLSERTKAGLAIARSKGRRIGRPRLQVQPGDIARLKAQGHSLRAIGRSLGIGDGSVRRLLASPA
ncbi:MAG TPA: recombinase family protein [Nitrososphaera sp.]|nr:recombinase family protein [Nitrososphaera sp.]